MTKASNSSVFFRLRAWGFALVFFALGLSAEARAVRVATFNVEVGIAAPGSEKYDAQKAVLRRIGADIVAFQELTRATEENWVRLAEELGYAHRAVGQLGPFAGNMLVGFWSRFPIEEAVSVASPPETREFTRLPLRVRIAVPGAARPLVLWNMHHKAVFEARDDFRRAVEARRIVEDIQRHRREYPKLTELIVLGDMNDDPSRREQSVQFEKPPAGLPRTFALGADIAFPLRYRWFPTDAYAGADFAFRAIPALRQNSDIPTTHFYTNLRLDWVFASEALWRHPDGPPRGEIYHSEWDAPAGGLPKNGEPPSRETSLRASDHYPVFADMNLEDAPRDPMP